MLLPLTPGPSLARGEGRHSKMCLSSSPGQIANSVWQFQPDWAAT